MRSRWLPLGQRFSLPVSLTITALTAVALVGLLSATGASSAPNGAQAPTAIARPPPSSGAKAGPEVVEQRTATSRTYLLEGDRRLTEVFASPVNFRNRQGAWQPIDTDLVKAPDGSYGIAAAGFDVSLPERAGTAVRVARDDAWLSFALKGATPVQVDADGSTARYANALSGVHLDYQTQTSGLKETLTLARPEAAEDLSFALDMALDLRPVERDSGGIDLVDRDGETKLAIAPPSMVDAAGVASGKVSYRLGRSADGWTLDVIADRGWLTEPTRQFPVAVDPSVNIGPQRDCTIDALTPTTTYCNDAFIRTGWDGSSDRRALLRFDVNNSIPAGVHIEDGWFELYHQSRTTTVNKLMGVYRMTRDWNNVASWDRWDATNAWTTTGSDFDASKNWRPLMVGAQATGVNRYFGIIELIQKWRDGEFPNYGVVLKDAVDRQASNGLTFGSSEALDPNQRPRLGIVWDQRVGIERQFTFDRQQLADRSSLGVNVANGNLVYSANDVSIAGTGLALGVSRHFNNLGAQYTTDVGRGWQASIGASLKYMSGNDRMLTGPAGEKYVFHNQPTGSFTSPSAIDATLAVEGSGFKLTWDKTEQIWHFNADGDLASQNDRNGNQITYTYSAPGTLDHITDTQGRTIGASYWPSGYLQSLTDPTGRTWNYAYNASGQPSSYTDPDNKTTTYTYTAAHDLATITDPRTTVTKLEYDVDSRITAIKRNYNDVARTWTAQTRYAYSSPTAPCDPARDFGKTVVTSPRGFNTTYCYDIKARVTQVVDANGNARSATYTPNSDVATSTAPGPVTTNFGHDSLNNLTSMDQPAGERSTMEYTSVPHPRSVTKATSPGRISQVFAYDTPGNMTTVSDGGSPTQVQAKLEYNGQAGGTCTNDPTTHAGTIRCAIDGNGNTTRYAYDANGNLTTITPPLPLGATRITYDALSRVRTVEDGKGQTRTYTYDTLDRVTQIAYSSGGTIAYAYDANGNRTTDAGVTFTYDTLNRLTRDSGASYTWDASSNLDTFRDAGGTVTYGYDNADRLTSLAEPGGTCTVPVSLCTTFAYTTRNQRSRITFPSGAAQTIGYDTSDRPTSITATNAARANVMNVTYGYGASDLLQQQIDLRTLLVTRYGYDFLGRMTGAIESDFGGRTTDSRRYTYDLASNRTQQNINGTITTYGYNAANQLCWEQARSLATNTCPTPPGATSYTYDANGNMLTNSAGLDLRYNSRDQTTDYTTPGRVTRRFAYRGPGQTQRTSSWPIPNPVVLENNTLLGLTRAGTTQWTRDPSGALISQNAGGTRHYYLTDIRGSVVGLLDNAGALAQTYKYDPYGTVTATTGSVTNPFQYTGAHLSPDGSSGLYRMGARYYNPALGRWTQQDPIDQAADLRDGNRYAYAAADPINMVDPAGTCSAGIGIGQFSWCAVGEVSSRETAGARNTVREIATSCVVGAGVDVLGDLLKGNLSKKQFLRRARRGPGVIGLAVGCGLEIATDFLGL